MTPSCKWPIDLALVLGAISKALKGKMPWSKDKLSIPVKDYFEENVHIFIFQSGETKQLSLLTNYWALLSIYRNQVYATERTCFETEMADCFNDLKNGESFVRRTRKLSVQFFSPVWGTTTIVQTMTAYLGGWLWTINN